MEDDTLTFYQKTLRPGSPWLGTTRYVPILPQGFELIREETQER